jgi:DNA (cytosine-5)-methyltransferase 1
MPYKFIDLFAGLGGFHIALKKLGCECVFASEIKEDLRKLYKINFPETPIIEGDITKIKPEEIPNHDILCAGFPCQPFSQAGKRQGFKDDKDRGNLFYYIRDIVKYHRPQYILLENVANLKNHDNGHTWETIKRELEKLDYEVAEPAILSPHQFAIPQHRRRIYIVCIDKKKGSLDRFRFPKPLKQKCNIKKIIEENDTNIIKIKSDTRHQLEVWQEFINQTIAHGDKIPRFPIWAMEFGANYDYEKAPAFQSLDDLNGKKGKLGIKITGQTVEECVKQLPIYAQTGKSMIFPKWKISYIKQNRAFYEKHKEWLNEWIKKIVKFDNSHQKLEWNCGADAKPDLYKNIIQFRASGIRVKLPTYSPALNLVGTQVPILPWVKIPTICLNEGEPKQGRYMTVKEAAKLQGMQDLSFGNNDFSLSTTRIFEALGNAVNVNIVERIANNLFKIK